MRVSYEEAVTRGWITAEAVPKQETAKKSRKADAEGSEQVQLLKRFRELYPAEGPLLIHIPNGGSRKNAFEGWRLKEQGVRAGVSDLLLPVARGGYYGIWIEFKASPPYDAKVTESQLEWLELMKAQGYAAHLCRGQAEAMQVLSSYLAQPRTVIAK